MAHNEEKPIFGAGAAFFAFSFWGIFPVFFKAVSQIPAFEILAHRVLWTVVFLAFIILFKKNLKNVRAVFQNRKLLITLFISSLLVTTNWLVFIWAVINDRVLESSLGYFINPLINVALGMLFLREKLRNWQWIAVGLSAIGVGNLIWQHGTIPWVAISVSISFGLYGLVRKITSVDAVSGLFVETILVMPPMLAYLIYISLDGSGSFNLSNLKIMSLLITAGLMTAIPLLLFVIATKNLKLSTVGFFQYIAPTAHFLLAVYLYDEPFTDTHKITFCLIWFALAIYSFDSIASRQKD